jgi:hypothetical protein
MRPRPAACSPTHPAFRLNLANSRGVSFFSRSAPCSACPGVLSDADQPRNRSQSARGPLSHRAGRLAAAAAGRHRRRARRGCAAAAHHGHAASCRCAGGRAVRARCLSLRVAALKVAWGGRQGPGQRCIGWWEHGVWGRGPWHPTRRRCRGCGWRRQRQRSVPGGCAGDARARRCAEECEWEVHGYPAGAHPLFVHRQWFQACCSYPPHPR